jgi:hypothetical protein
MGVGVWKPIVSRPSIKGSAKLNLLNDKWLKISSAKKGNLIEKIRIIMEESAFIEVIFRLIVQEEIKTEKVLTSRFDYNYGKR